MTYLLPQACSFNLMTFSLAIIFLPPGILLVRGLSKVFRRLKETINFGIIQLFTLGIVHAVNASTILVLGTIYFR